MENPSHNHLIIYTGFQATQFRIWATKTLKDFIIKGFVLDDERMKQGSRFGKDYLEELLEGIREIRASGRRFDLKIRDLLDQFRPIQDARFEREMTAYFGK